MDNRLLTARNIWLATVRPDNRPHLVPIWFVSVNEHIYICTAGDSVKARNITVNPQVSFSLEDGNKPLIGSGTARILISPYPVEIIAAFQTKFDWDITTEATYNTLIEITPHKWLSW